MSRKQTLMGRQAEQVAALDKDIQAAKDALKAAQDARTAADAALDAQGMANAAAEAGRLRSKIAELETMRKAAASIPAPTQRDAWQDAVDEMRRAWQDRVDKIEGQIRDADERLRVIDAALEKAAIAADVAGAAKLRAEQAELEAQNAVARDMLRTANTMPVYQVDRLRELWDVEDARIGAEWDAAVRRLVTAAGVFKRAWHDVQRVTGEQDRVAGVFGQLLQKADSPIRLQYRKGVCFETDGEILEAANLCRYSHPAIVLRPLHRTTGTA